MQSRQFEAFCPECGSPVGARATLDPIQIIQTDGFLLHKALKRPKLIVLLGIWILHLPVLMIGVYFAIHLILNGSGWADFVFFWGAIVLAYIGFVILYKVTKNYLTIRKKA